MKLQGVHDGRLFATRGVDLYVSDGHRGFTARGRLPSPPLDGAGLRTRLLTNRPWRAVTATVVGAVPTVNVWPLTRTHLLGTVGPFVVASADGGRHWVRTRRLPSSSGPMGVLPSAVAHRDGTTYLGEYPLDTAATPRVLKSTDRGRTWSVATALSDARHVHSVQFDPYTDDCWVTTGDTDAAARIGRLQGDGIDVVGGGSQEWRAVELAFTPSAVLWGMDCAYAETNTVFRLPRSEIGAASPTPQAVHEVPGSVYYSASFQAAGTSWVAFSTAMEVGRDSTGPSTQEPTEAPGIVVAASAASNCREWVDLAAYRRQRHLADGLPGCVPRANGYVFLAADPDCGLLVNPYNTRAGNATIQRVPATAFERWAGSTHSPPETAAESHSSTGG